MTEMKTYTFEIKDLATGLFYTWHGIPEYLFDQLIEQCPVPIYHLLNLLGHPANIYFKKEDS